MKAYETAFQKMVEGTKQFQIPLYQRPYSWGKDELSRLWEDLLEQIENDRAAPAGSATTHFLGSVVMAPGASAASDMTRWLVIDGQQRLTSLTLALAAVRDRLRDLGDGGDEESDAHQNADRIHDTYLVNRYKKRDDKFRLLPTQVDRAVFKAVVDGRPKNGDTDGVEGAHHFFLQKMATYSEDELLEVEAAVGRRLSLVEIQADSGDNVFRIFESLNDTGKGLSQSDLLRNYVFMLLPETGEEVYDEVWSPMQDELGPEHLETLAWLDLVLRGDERAKQSEVYYGQQKRLKEVAERGGEAAVRTELEQLWRLGQLLLRVVEPAHEDDPELRAALARLVAWGNTIYRALALRLLQLRDQDHASTEEVVRALSYVESYLVRRLFAGIQSQGLNRIMMSSPAAVQTGVPVDESVHRYLSLPRHRWPSDRALRSAIATRNFYWTGRAPQRTFVLRRLEESYCGDEPVDFRKAKLSIEHVMPQSLTPHWGEVLAGQADDDETPAELHARLLHTLGNLTLTSQNSRLSNHLFERKQQILDRSALEMNREIADADSWGRPEIERRSERLADRAIALWPAPLPAEEGEEGPELIGEPTRAALAAIPSGGWTSYRDVGQLVGAKAATIASLLRQGAGLPNAHRVLATDGVPATAEAEQALAAEGVAFTGTGAAAPDRRLSAATLATLTGMEVNERVEQEQMFLDQLAAHLSADEAQAVTGLMETWERLGGVLDYRTSSNQAVSCRLFAWERSTSPDIRWPLVTYPQYGNIEVVFQYLRTRPPFDDADLRLELLKRLNQVPGIELPEAALERRPSFPVSALTGESQEIVRETLEWFLGHCREWLAERR
ncbi:DUF262 domain-containing protein [Nocardiopsis suaedae]|uniref:DUF262 domain-containing protein n=1 Tax=Nocardiopsis suaedae TaxID=3018444 RepID=A0ABT4TTL8_9ACTN|nr:DUF262 domain-containing protein [Nocardiopsis suaedae]MDA2807786.1 DUF262 domain-containing protein [Nocardiopsis suaedae]